MKNITIYYQDEIINIKAADMFEDVVHKQIYFKNKNNTIVAIVPFGILVIIEQ